MEVVGKYFDNVTQYIYVKDRILSTFSEVINNRTSTDKVLSFDESVVETFRQLEEAYKNPENYARVTGVGADFMKAALGKVFDRSIRGTNIKVKAALIDEFFGHVSMSSANTSVLRDVYAEQLKTEEAKLEELIDLRESLQETTEDEREKLEDEILETSSKIEGINDEIFNSDLRDPKEKITGRVKQRLVSIPYFRDGRKEFADFARVYSLVLNYVNQVDISSLDNVLSHLNERLSIFGGVSQVRNSIRQATGSFLLNIVQNIREGLDPATGIKHNLTFRKDASYDNYYAIHSKDTKENVANVTLAAARNDSKYTVLLQTADQSTDAFSQYISEETGLAKSDIARAYYFFEDMNFLRSLVAAVGSLRENRPFVAQQQWDFGKYRMKYFANRYGGAKSILESSVVDKFDKYVETRAIFNDLFPEGSGSLIESTRRAKTYAQKKDALKAFMATIGFAKGYVGIIDDLDNKTVDDVFHSYSFALSDMQETYAKPFDRESEDYEDYKQGRTAAGLLGDQGSFVNALVSALNTHESLIESNSYIRGDGKRSYRFIDASFQTGLLSNIKATVEGKRTRQLDHVTITREGKIASTTNPFIKNNIFARGDSKARFFGFIDHDSIKNKDQAAFAKTFWKENSLDFHKRNVIAGFMARFASTKSTYYQYLLVPTQNRTTTQALEVTLLAKDEAKKAVGIIVDNEKSRPKGDYMKLKNYSKNVDQFRFPGLTGDVNSKTKVEAMKTVEEHVAKQVQELSKYFMLSVKEDGTLQKPQVPMDERHLELLSERFKFTEGLKDYMSGQKYAIEKTAKDITPQRAKEVEQQRANSYNALVTKALELFYYNHIVNSYSISQMMYGDEAFYKDKEDQTKRTQVFSATGDSLLSDERYGMKPTSRVMVVDDIPGMVPLDLTGTRVDAYGESYETTDGEGFILPEYYEKIASTYGIESATDVVLKPVYAHINKNGVPTLIKYSAKVLTDELVKQFPHLSQVREKMREHNCDQFVYGSSMKSGAPSKLASTKANGQVHNISEDSIVEIDNNHLRFQLNPAKAVDITTRNLSQGTAFMNTNGKNTAEATELHNLNAFVIENGLRGMVRELRLTSKGSLTGKSMDAIRKKMMSVLEDVPGGADLYRLLNAKDESGQQVSLSLPLIGARAVSTLSSMVSRATTQFRFPGSKLVLQADVGLGRELKYKDDEGFTEVILPQEYAKYMSKGDKFIPGGKNGVIAFRIPSTNYHSLIAMKVVGFYPTPAGSKGNVVIAPSPIVYYHGSD